jgi:hypothetical protein
MRCIAHKAEAVAVCSYCGRALCPDCLHSSEAPRIVCSSRCEEALAEGEKAMKMMLQHGRQNAKASAFYCYLCGGLSAVAAIAAWFMLPSPFLILFTGGCALVLTAYGVWYNRIARQHSHTHTSLARPITPDMCESAGYELGRRSEVQAWNRIVPRNRTLRHECV